MPKNLSQFYTGYNSRTMMKDNLHQSGSKAAMDMNMNGKRKQLPSKAEPKYGPAGSAVSMGYRK